MSPAVWFSQVPQKAGSSDLTGEEIKTQTLVELYEVMLAVRGQSGARTQVIWFQSQSPFCSPPPSALDWRRLGTEGHQQWQPDCRMENREAGACKGPSTSLDPSIFWIFPRGFQCAARIENRGTWTVFFKLCLTAEAPGDLSRHRMLGPTPQVSDLIRLSGAH